MGKRGSKKSSKKSSKRSGRRSGKRRSRRSSSARIHSNATVPPLPVAGGGYTNSAVPDSSTLLAYKLLKDSAGNGNNRIFDDMLQNELKYLYGGISILRNDPKLSSEMGGETMANAAILAQILKAKTKELDFTNRIEGVATNILFHEYDKPGKQGMAPGNIPASILQKTANGTKLHYRAAGATGHDVQINAAVVNLPAIGPVPAIPRVNFRPHDNNNNAHANWVAQMAITDADGFVRQLGGINPLRSRRY